MTIRYVGRHRVGQPLTATPTCTRMRARPLRVDDDFLRCSVCSTLIRRDPFVSDVARLTLHWMSRHLDRYLELHPEATPWLTP